MRRAPSFWWRDRPGAAAMLLTPVSAIWAARAGRRMDEAPAMVAPVPVICVGNLVAGGAGKTPAALAMAVLAKKLGFTPGFLTRGYGGTEKGPLLVKPEIHDAGRVGDEPLLLAAIAPTVVCGNRPLGVAPLIEAGVDLIVMDDGFQNPSLAKDLTMVVVDAAVGIGNGRVIPSGPLRAPLETQLRHTGALVVVGKGDAAEPVLRLAAEAGKPVFRARLKPKRVRDWQKMPILAFAGIARPEKFFESLRAAKAPVAVTMPFPDHHRYSEAEAMRLITRADAETLRLVTTEKDLARLAGETGALAKLRERAEPFSVTLEFEDKDGVSRLIGEAAERVKLRGL